MAEVLFIPSKASKSDTYEAVLPQISSLVQGETDLIANLANVAAVLKEAFGFFWVGFYLDKGKDLVLGPFQGTLACTRIPYEKGVCGAAYSQRKTMLVPDVEKFPGHIACSSLSKSEIVVPVFSGGKVVAVLDVDSDKLNDFDETDKIYLEKLCSILSEKLSF
jgi:GAF domain-containing protein